MHLKFTTILWISCFAASNLAATEDIPKPAPRVFVNVLDHGKCADGLNVRAKLEERADKILLVRAACKDTKGKVIGISLPKGTNELESGILVYRGKVFEERFSENQKVKLFCRNEGTDANDKAHSVKVLLREVMEDGQTTTLLLLSAQSPAISGWSAVVARKEGTSYRGSGSMNPSEFIELKLRPGGLLADVDYSFEIGKGKIGSRQRASGSASKLNCYVP